MYFPLFEYTFVAYIVADYVNVKLHWKKGLVSTRCYRTFQVLLPLILIGCALFRLIFVMIAYVNVGGHTFGFLLLQISLFLVACLNVWFVVEARMEYRCLCGRTKEIACAYLLCNIPISAVKMFLTAYAVLNGRYPGWTANPVGGVLAGQVVDWTWMLFNAVIPLVISFVRSRTENPLEISVDLEPLRCCAPVSGRDGDDGGGFRGANDFPGVRELADARDGGAARPRDGEILPPHRAPKPDAGKKAGGDYFLWRANVTPRVRGNIKRPPLKGECAMRGSLPLWLRDFWTYFC